MFPSPELSGNNPFASPLPGLNPGQMETATPFTPQGAGSVPNAAPSPPATQAAGTPAQPAGGVIPQQQAAPAEINPDDLLAQIDAKEKAGVGDEGFSSLLQQIDAKEKAGQAPEENDHSGIYNWAAGINKSVASAIAYPVRALSQVTGLADVGIGKAAKALGGRDFGQTLEDAGKKIIAGANDGENGPEINMIRNIMEHIGGGNHPDPDSMLGKIGENTAFAMANVMAIQAAAPAWAAKTGMGALTVVQRAIGNAALHNPWMGIIGEAALGTPAATIAGEATEGNPTASGLAGMAGNTAATLLGNPVQRILGAASKYGVKLTTSGAQAVVDTFDRVASKVAGIEPKANPSPLVPDDIIDAHRAAEQAARNAGEVVVQAAAAMPDRAHWDGNKMVRGNPDTKSPEYIQARTLLDHAQALEARANTEADAAWQAIPASVRNNYNQQSEAIRSEASDVVRPQLFAEEQLAGDRHLVNGKIEAALSRVKATDPGMTSERYAQEISAGLQDAEKMAAKMEGRMYGRVNLKERLPERAGPLQDLAAATHEMRTQFDPDDVPVKSIQKLQTLFAPQSSPGVFQQLPTLQQVRAAMTNLGQQRREELAKLTPNYPLVKNMSQLSVLGAKWIGEAFPDNIPLQQAREFSQFYHQNFSNSDMLPFLRTTAQGGQRIRAEDTLNQLFQRPRAFTDVYAAVNNLMDHPSFDPVVKVTPGSPERPSYSYQRLGQPKEFGKIGPQPVTGSGQVVSPGYPPSHGSSAGAYGNTGKLFNPDDQARLGQLQSDLENGIRASFQEELGKVIATPKTTTGELPSVSEAALKQQAIINKWGDRIKSFSNVAAEVQAAMQDALTGVAERRAIEHSALAKFFETKDPQVAVQRIWSSANPAALARNLITGEAGVGGFAKDPAALEGFRAALIDKLFEQTKGDPRAILRILAEQSKTARLLDVAVGSDRMDRLQRMASNLVNMQDQSHSKWAEVLTTGARLASLKVSAMLPKIGEGAELMQASIFSQTAKKAVQGILHKQPAEELLKDAIRNPAAEKLLLGSQGGNWKGYTDAMRDMHRDQLMLRRVLRFGDGIIQAYNATQSDDNNGPRPVDHRASLSHSNVGAARGLSLSDFNPVGSAQAMDLSRMPSSSNIEDRTSYKGPRRETMFGDIVRSGNPSQTIIHNRSVINVDKQARDANDRNHGVPFSNQEDARPYDSQRNPFQ